MSLLVQMVRCNAPLHSWKDFEKQEGRSTWTAKEDTRKMAKMMLAQCSHPLAVELIAKEFELLPPQLRLDFRSLANQENSSSGNVRKGLQRLDEKLGGKLLREEHVETVMRRVETKYGVSYKKEKVNPAVAGATRKYGIVN